MNKSRELFLLFTPDLMARDIVNKLEWFEAKGYTLIHSSTSPNDEPPYILVTFWGKSTSYTVDKAERAFRDEDSEDSYSFYLIRSVDAERYIHLMNSHQKDYCDYYVEGIMTRNAGEHNLTAKQYADGAKIRRPKTKRIHALPYQLQQGEHSQQTVRA